MRMLLPMSSTRPPAVAGSFYPADAERLRAEVEGHLRGAAPPAAAEPPPKAVIVPHAGYVYSGAVAAAAYGRVARLRDRIERVVLLGPSHRVGFEGLALPSVDAFETPLGVVPIDREACERVGDLPQVRVLDAAHAREHSLEVQLPFLQRVLGTFRLVPFSVGDATAEQVAEVLERLWGGPETLVVISSDLSHYHPYDDARRLDAATARSIEALRHEALGPEQACGCVPISGLLLAARRRGLEVRPLDLRSSGDTAGPRDQVVGYGAWSFARGRS
jgi:AmmeMemoRadiSam system protein B